MENWGIQELEIKKENKRQFVIFGDMLYKQISKVNIAFMELMFREMGKKDMRKDIG